MQKLTNFRAYLQPHLKSPEHAEWLSKFSTLEEVMPYLLQLKALQAVGKVDEAVRKLQEELEIADPAVVAKIKLYLECFVELTQ